MKKKIIIGVVVLLAIVLYKIILEPKNKIFLVYIKYIIFSLLYSNYIHYIMKHNI